VIIDSTSFNSHVYLGIDYSDDSLTMPIGSGTTFHYDYGEDDIYSVFGNNPVNDQ